MALQFDNHDVAEIIRTLHKVWEESVSLTRQAGRDRGLATTDINDLYNLVLDLDELITEATQRAEDEAELATWPDEDRASLSLARSNID